MGGVPLDQPVKTPGSFGGRFAWPLNGTLVGSGANSFVAQLVGNGNGGDIETTGWQFYSVNLESLAAGEHVLAIGGYNNQKTYNNEQTEILIDQVTVIKL